MEEVEFKSSLNADTDSVGFRGILNKQQIVEWKPPGISRKFLIFSSQYIVLKLKFWKINRW